MSCVDKANAFVHWRRTISTDGITHTSGFVQALPKIKSGKSLTIYLAIATGDGLGVYGASANYIVLVDQTKFPSPDWKIVRPTHESQPNALQLEVKIREDEVAFRLKNNSGTTLRWNSCGFLVLCEDKPLFVRVTQVTSSDVTEIYEPSELVVPGLVTLQSQIDNLTINLNALDADLTAEINARIADVDSEEAARIAADATLQAFATDRANHTGTQLAATISDFASAARAQTEAELVAGANVTITPSGAGATRQLTIAGTVAGGGDDIAKRWPWDELPAVPSALDDQFPGPALDVKWAAVGGAGLTTTLKRSWLFMRATATGATFNCRGIEQVLPAGVFSVIAIIKLFAQQYSLPAIHIRNATTNAMVRWAMFHNSGAGTDPWFGVHRYNSLTNRTAIIAQTSIGGWSYELALRITNDGTNFRFDYSIDGFRWINYVTEAVGTSFGAGMPDRVGLSLDPVSATLEGLGGFQAFRYAANATTGIGAFA